MVLFELVHEVGDDLALAVRGGDRELGVEDDVAHGFSGRFVVPHDLRELARLSPPGRKGRACGQAADVIVVCLPCRGFGRGGLGREDLEEPGEGLFSGRGRVGAGSNELRIRGGHDH